MFEASTKAKQPIFLFIEGLTSFYLIFFLFERGFDGARLFCGGRNRLSLMFCVAQSPLLARALRCCAWIFRMRRMGCAICLSYVYHILKSGPWAPNGVWISAVLWSAALAWKWAGVVFICDQTNLAAVREFAAAFYYRILRIGMRWLRGFFLSFIRECKDSSQRHESRLNRYFFDNFMEALLWERLNGCC